MIAPRRRRGDRRGAAVDEPAHHVAPAREQISGTSANGMPNDSTTWLSTSARVGSSPIASTMSAGAIVTRRRSDERDRARDEALHDHLAG